MRTCKVEGCFNTEQAKGLCSKHYYRFSKYGNVYKYRKPIMGCKIEGCNNKHRGKGYCNKHYSLYKKYGKRIKLGKWHITFPWQWKDEHMKYEKLI
ncbi:MAG: hypothetical protein PF693_09985 [Spirochaetia bacterium]|nr:hypothetical protein [Spirochaetia bacterium]